MGLRKAASYSKKHVRPYTRNSKVKSKAYIKTIPPKKIVKYSMGNEVAFREGKLPFVIEVISDEKVQIRDNAIESCRQYINKRMDKSFLGQYYFTIHSHPHHIQRENKMLTGAGSDRMQTGMQLSFGKAIGRAAIVRKGDPIFILAVANQKAMQETRKILVIIKSKLPCKTRILGAEVKQEMAQITG